MSVAYILNYNISGSVVHKSKRHIFLLIGIVNGLTHCLSVTL